MAMIRRLRIVLLILATGCVPPSPETPNPPVLNPAIYASDCGAIYRQELGRAADPAGLIGCENQMAAAKQAGAAVPQEGFRAWLRQQSEWTAHQETVKVLVLPRLVIRNAHFFGLENGQRFYGIEATDFNLYARFLNNEDLSSVRQQRKDLGFNMRRVFTRYDIAPQYGIGRLRLDEHPDLYERLSAFLQLMSRDGAYVNLVAYTGPYTEGFDLDHWARLCQAVQGSTNVILSLVNEVDQTANAMDITKFAPCPGILSSRGSMGGGQWPAKPVWAWSEYHSNGQSEWWRKTGHEPFEMSNDFNVPVHAAENVRFPDQDRNLEHACSAGGNSALLNAAATFHSVHGKNSTLFEGDELAAAQEWVRCAKAVPLDCQDLAYDLLNRGEPNAGGRRVYTRGGSSACTVTTSRQ